MKTAIIESVTEKTHPEYGPEKISKIILQPEGESRTAYTKPAAQSIYSGLQAGLSVEVEAKSNGKGYIIKSIIGEAPPAQPRAGNGRAPAHRPGTPGAGPHDIAEFIKTSAGQYAYCVKMLREKFDEVGVTDISDDLLKAGATSIFIATKDKFH